MGPCGGTSDDPGEPSNAMTNVQGGDKLHIKIQETIFHPVFYRVALSVNGRDELPKDPVVRTEPSGADRAPFPQPSITRRSRPSSPMASSNTSRNSTGNRKRMSTSRTSTVPMHAAGDRVHGVPRSQQGWRLHLPPLRRAADSRESGQADRRAFPGGAEVSEAGHRPLPHGRVSVKPTVLSCDRAA